MSSPGSTALHWLRARPFLFDAVVAGLVVAISALLIFGSPEEFDTGWPEVAAGVGAFVVIAARRVQPWLFLGVALVWTAVHIGIWERPTPTIFAVLVLLATVCVRLERWPAIALGAAIASSLYVLALVSNDAELGDARAVIAIAWTAAAVGIADAVRSWRRYREAAEAEVRAARLAAEAQAQQHVSDERLVVARELHDLLAHNLSVMNVQTGVALHLLRSDPDKAEASLEAARNAGRTVLDEMSDLVRALRSDRDDASPTGALPTIERIPQLIESVRAAGATVQFTESGSPRRLSAPVSLAVYRILQESLTNASKHGVGPIDAELTWTDEGVAITVANDIAAETGEGGGHGLVGMIERAESAGGRLTAGANGCRFVVEARLPATVEGAHERGRVT